MRHSSFVESEDEDVEEEDVEDEPEPSAFNAACCRRRFRACLLRVRALADSFSSSDLFGAGMAWDLKDFWAVYFRVSSLTSPGLGAQFFPGSRFVIVTSPPLFFIFGYCFTN